ncbi:MAG: trehalose-phosphatase [Bacteroidetes bacterium]|nr:trehalose-phosphatase [Bacteroidota bacterium]
MAFDAAILDMDGVITRTVPLHAEAWKRMFDEFLREKEGEDFEPLDIDRDYRTYIDGKLRQEGIRSFLDARGIVLPEGTPDDDPAADTVYGLGKRKNAMFLELLEAEGVHVYEDTLEMLKKWRECNIKLAVISSSRNCRHIIDSAGLTDYFDVRVDGKTSDEEGLKSKPAPDIFLRARALLNVPANRTIVLEDAISGVQAGKRGGFAMVAGIARSGEEQELRDAGADIVVKRLTELEDIMKKWKTGGKAEELPDAIENIEAIMDRFEFRRPALFLDYDGTLTPIVSDPDDALLPDTNKALLEKLAHRIPVGVITGRDRRDIKGKMGISSIIYAGSHGFDITGPDGLEMQYEEGRKMLPALDEAEKSLTDALKDVDGSQVERKKYAIAVHYRNVEDKDIEEVEKAVQEALQRHTNLKEGRGKKVIELKPDLDWHKGHALTWLMEALELDASTYIPVFIGDDITDEDAFETIQNDGVGIIVGTHGDVTAAAYRLRNTNDVTRLLDRLLIRIKQREEFRS